MTYSYYDSDSTLSGSVRPNKLVVNSDGTIEGYPIDNKTTGTAAFTSTSTLAPLSDHTPQGFSDTVGAEFSTASGNSAANSSVVQNAHESPGSFVISEDFNGDGDPPEVFIVNFHPSGDYFTYNFVDPDCSESGASQKIEFGFGIKDPDYTNDY
jgi:hypothetical protein